MQQSFDDITKRVDKFQYIMQAQVDLQKTKSVTTDRNISRSEEESKLLDEVLDSLDTCKRARDGNDEEVEHLAKMLLGRKKQLFRSFIEEEKDGKDD
ncbi:unnamed protein product [Agarophyton chilense]